MWYFAIIIYSGYVLSGVGFLLLLLPFSKKIQNRRILSIACLVTVLGLFYADIFGLAYSSKYTLAAIPAFISLIIFLKYFTDLFRIRPVAYNQVMIGSILFIVTGWGNFITVIFADNCAFGACV
jgi:hypothetical protein